MPKLIIDKADARVLVSYLGLGDKRQPSAVLEEAYEAAGRLKMALEQQLDHEHQMTLLPVVVELYATLERITSWAKSVEQVAYGVDSEQYRPSELVSSCTAILEEHAWLAPVADTEPDQKP